MKTCRQLSIVVMMLAACFFAPSAKGQEVQWHAKLQEELSLLKKTMEKAPHYRDRAQRQIDSLKRELKRVMPGEISREMRLNQLLTQREWNLYPDSSVNSALKALNLAEKVESQEAMVSSKILLIKALAKTGITTQAYMEMHKMEGEEMSESLKIDYWEACKEVLYTMQLDLPDNIYRRRYEEETNALTDSLLTLLPRGEFFHKYLWAEKMYMSSRYEESNKILEELMPKLSESQSLYSKCCQLQAAVAYKQGEMDKYAYYVAMLARYNVENNFYQGRAMASLATWLYGRGENSDAYDLMAFVVSTAEFGSSRVKPLTLASALPEIENSYRENMNKTNRRLWVVLIFGLLALAVAITATIRLYRRNKKESLLNKELKRTSQLQSSYMGSFISLCTVYSERLENLKNYTIRKIQAGQGQELLKLLKAGKVSEPQMETFYKIFDSAFLDLYPDFIEKINALLQPGQQFEVKDGGVLNPELRICALIRLGITEGTKISQILHYSPNTIYAYRNKLRNRALSRDTFDADLAKISTYEDESIKAEDEDWLEQIGGEREENEN